MGSPSGKFTRWSRDVVARIAGYRTHKVVAEWGAQCVLEGRSEQDDRLVVIDALDPNAAAHAQLEQAFREGSRTALGLKHPNVLEVLETGHCGESGLLFVVSEHPGEQTLATLLGDDGHLAEQDAVAIVQQVAEGLAAAAERRLSHGRIQPAAIGLDLASTPRIIGFGLPRPAPTEVADAHCLAPEQARTVGDADALIDVYGLGVVFYRCLTGGYPFTGDSYTAITAQLETGVIGDPREHEPEVSDAAAKVLAWMTAPRREDRYPTLHAASLDLLRLLGGEPPRGPSGGKLKHSQELVNLLRHIEERRPDDVTARGLWGTGPAYAFKVVLATQREVLQHKHFAKSTVVVGRSPKTDLPIDNPIVSREHAAIERIGGHFVLHPKSKTNPTEVNGSRLQAPGWIRPGQSFLLAGKFNVRAFWAPHRVAIDEAAVADHDSKSWVSPPTQRLKRVDIDAAVAAAEAKEKARKAPAPEEILPGQEGYLVYTRAGAEVRTLVNHPFQIGRSAVCDLRLKGEDVPHKAALVIGSSDGFRLYSVVADTTYVRLNGEPVADMALLEVGDEITVGDVTLRFLS